MDDQSQNVKAKLLYIELDNFKSFQGKHRFGLGLTNFSAIIGPNGSGNSNLCMCKPLSFNLAFF